jgi:hypothetical protein
MAETGMESKKFGLRQEGGLCFLFGLKEPWVTPFAHDQDLLTIRGDQCIHDVVDMYSQVVHVL